MHMLQGTPFQLWEVSKSRQHQKSPEVTTIQDLNLMGRNALLDFKIDVTALMRSKVCSVSKPLDINLHDA